MPQVDFTLEDVKRVIDERLDERFLVEREYTRQMMNQMIKESAEDVKRTVADEFVNFWDNNLGPAFDELHTELAEVKVELKRHSRLLDRHSKDIMELRAS